MTVKQSHELKQLQSRIAKLAVEIPLAKEDMQETAKVYQKKLNLKAELEKQVEELLDQDKGLVVSEHALLRYFERVLGFDLEEIKKEILTDKLTAQWKVLGKGKYPLKEGCRAVINNNVIVTIE